MDHPEPSPAEPLDELLRPPAPPPAGAPLQQALLLRTTRRLRLRRRLKRAGLMASLAACYLAGVLTVRLGTAPAAKPKGSEVARKPFRDGNEKRIPAPRPGGGEAEPKKNPEPPAEEAESALALEWRALDTPARRAELYRRAGDRYLAENDLASALRCYRGALAAGSAKDRAVAPGDNWLLLIAKQQRTKENRHANPDS